MRKPFLFLLNKLVLCLALLCLSFNANALDVELRAIAVAQNYIIDSETGEISQNVKYLPEIYINGAIAPMSYIDRLERIEYEIYFTSGVCNYQGTTGVIYPNSSYGPYQDNLDITESLVQINGETVIKYDVVITNVSDFYTSLRSFYFTMVGNPTVIIELDPDPLIYYASSPCDTPLIPKRCCSADPTIIQGSFVEFGDPKNNKLIPNAVSFNSCHPIILFPNCSGGYPCIGNYMPDNGAACDEHAIPAQSQDYNGAMVEEVRDHGSIHIPYHNQAAEGRDGKSKTRANMTAVDLKIHPNPATDFAILSISDQDHLQGVVQIKNLAGQVIKTIPINHQVNEVHLSTGDLASGLYFIHWTSGNVYGTKKLALIK